MGLDLLASGRNGDDVAHPGDTSSGQFTHLFGTPYGVMAVLRIFREDRL